jgi:hypothetical protein
MTSCLAVAVYRVEPPLAGANSTPDAVSGILVLAQLIFITWRGTDIIRSFTSYKAGIATDKVGGERQPIRPRTFHWSKVGFGS